MENDLIFSGTICYYIYTRIHLIIIYKQVYINFNMKRLLYVFMLY